QHPTTSLSPASNGQRPFLGRNEKAPRGGISSQGLAGTHSAVTRVPSSSSLLQFMFLFPALNRLTTRRRRRSCSASRLRQSRDRGRGCRGALRRRVVASSVRRPLCSATDLRSGGCAPR